MKKGVCTLILSLLFFPINAKYSVTPIENGSQIYSIENTEQSPDIIGIIYSVGLRDFITGCPPELISQLILSPQTISTLRKYGSNCVAHIYDEFTEISAKISPEDSKKFIKLILENHPNLANLEFLKERLIIKNKIDSYFAENAIDNEILAVVSPQKIINEHIIHRLNKSSIEKSLEKYQTAHVDFVLCQKNSSQNQELLKFTKNRKLKRITTTNKYQFKHKDIILQGKFFNRDITFVYEIPKEIFSKKYFEIKSIINYQIFSYLQKYSSIINCYDFSEFTYGGRYFLKFSAQVKSDVALKQFEELYKNVLSIIKSKPIPKEILKTVAKIAYYSDKDTQSHSSLIYKDIINGYMEQIPPYFSVKHNVLDITQKEIQKFIEEIFEKRFILKLVSKYKAEV